VSTSTAIPPNQRPPPEVAAALKRIARLNYKLPFTGAADIRRREALWLLRGRGASDGEVKARIGQISAEVGFSSSKQLGEHLRLLGAEKPVWHSTTAPDRSDAQTASRNQSISPKRAQA
jgi:hypothetical protein